MPVVYSNALKDTRMEAVLAAIDAESGAADIQLGTSGMSTVLATIPLAEPAGSVAGQKLTFGGMPREANAAAAGTAAEARIRDGAGSVVVSGLTVGTSGTDVVLSSTTIAEGQPVRIDSAEITHG